MRPPSFLVVLWLATAGQAVAGTLAMRAGVLIGPWYAPYGAPYPAPFVYDSLGRCLSPYNCPDYEQFRQFLDRYERNYGQRLAPSPVLAAPLQPRDVAPTPEAHIQPAYRGASQIRPEFRRSGEPLEPGSKAAKPAAKRPPEELRSSRRGTAPDDRGR